MRSCSSRGERECSTKARRSGGCRSRGVRRAAGRRNPDELRVDDVAMRREEAGVARLQAQDLAPVVLEDGDFVLRDDVVTGHAIGEDAVRDLEADEVADADVVDV